MIHRQTQTPEYWAAYALTSEDTDFLYTLILESGRPKSTRELAIALMQARIEQERAALRARFINQKNYQPQHTYAVGERIVFPALRMTGGEVVGTRAGYNPEVGEFEVIRVRFSDGSDREFAARYPYPHRLNEEDFTRALDDAAWQSAETLFAQYGEHVAIAINETLAHHLEFIRIGDEWFLRGMMAEVNIGHLNLAEAVLDMANGGPLTTDVILRDLGLPTDIGNEIQEASLNSALSHDERFDDVGLADRSAWFLRRLEPPEVLSTPSVLQPVFVARPAALSEELSQWVESLDDEWNRDDYPPLGEAESATVILTYPHRAAGTLGWSRRLAAVLPHTHKPRVPVRFRDRANGREMLVWLVREGRYLWGLSGWYRANDLPAGAYIEIARSDEEGVFWINIHRRRPRREWVRLATLRDGHMRLETAQRAVSCEVDELMAIFADNIQTADAATNGRVRDVAQATREAFPEIAKLSPQGNVHIRTLHAVVNALVRTTPRDILAVLLSSDTYAPVGDGYWHLSNV